jgi:pilus assembly protein Flp/PilA
VHSVVVATHRRKRVERQSLACIARPRRCGVAHALRLSGRGRGRALAGGRIRNRSVRQQDARSMERDVMNLKNLTYYLRAKLGMDESGQDLLEYALLVALIALVSVGVIAIAGSNVKTIFTNIGTSLDTTP